MTRQALETGELELRRALRSLREGPPAPASARERLRGSLRLTTVSAPFASGPAASAPPATSTRLARLASRGSSLTVLGGLGAVAMVGAWLTLGPRRGRESTPPPAAAHWVEEPRARDLESAAQPPKAAPSTELHPAAPVAAMSAESKPTTRTPRNVSLAAERRLIDAARAALVAGDTAFGMDRLNHHARQFPRGGLAEEREALAIDALVATRRHDEARHRADAFRARYPESLFAPSVAAALGAIP